MKRDIALYIKDILKNMDKAGKFIKDITYEDFASDEKTNYAVLSTILCKFDKGANWAAPFLSELISNSTPFLTI